MTSQPIRRGWPALVVAAVLAAGLAGAPGGSTVALAAAPPDPVPASPASAAPEIADGRLLVGLVPGATSADAMAIAEEAGVSGVEVVGAQTLVVDAPPRELAAARVKGLRRDARVRFVEPNYRISAAFAPNDPYFPSLASLRDGQPGGIHAESAWNTTLGSRDVVVGVLDSGIDLDHPDLVGNLWTNRVGIGFCGYGTHGYNTFTNSCTPADDNGHGTHVAGIVGAVGNNGIGVTGVAPRASVMSLKMLDDQGDGSIAGAIEAINWAISAKAAGVDIRVLSASWGGNASSQALVEAIARAGDAGMIFVAAAGNAGVNVEQLPVYPCVLGLANVVCVAASRPNDTLAAFSDFGAVSVDLAAPGMNIVSTVPPGAIGGCGASLYCAFDGTSMAAPMVSGAAILALAGDPSLSVASLRARLLQAVDPVPALVGTVATGGRLNVCKLVAGCGGVAQSRPTAPRAVSVAVGHQKATIRWSPPNSNGNAFTITGYMVTGPNGSRNVGPLTTQLTLTGLTDNVSTRFIVRARNNLGAGPGAQEVARPLSGGYVADRSGGLSRVRVSPGPLPSPIAGPVTWPVGQNRVRGVALLPDGTGGYVLDAAGGLHPFRLPGHPLPPPATGGRSWPGLDRARGVALLPKGTGGYVVDAFGGLHPFGIGDNPRPRPADGGALWPSWDIARGVAIAPSGQGGYIVDGFGGIHSFTVGGAALPARPSLGPYFPGRDFARGIALSRGNGGGWVLDAYGGFHPFRTRDHRPAKPTSGPSWPGSDEARGLGI